MHAYFSDSANSLETTNAAAELLPIVTSASFGW